MATFTTVPISNHSYKYYLQNFTPIYCIVLHRTVINIFCLTTLIVQVPLFHLTFVFHMSVLHFDNLVCFLSFVKLQLNVPSPLSKFSLVGVSAAFLTLLRAVLEIEAIVNFDDCFWKLGSCLPQLSMLNRLISLAYLYKSYLLALGFQLLFPGLSPKPLCNVGTTLHQLHNWFKWFKTLSYCTEEILKSNAPAQPDTIILNRLKAKT